MFRSILSHFTLMAISLTTHSFCQPHAQELPSRSKLYYSVASPAYEYAMTRVMGLMEQYGMVYNDGGLDMPASSDKIEAAGFILSSYQNISRDRGRTLIVKATERFLKHLNSNKDVLPYLLKQPFDTNLMGVILYFGSQGELDFVHLNAGLVTFYTRKPPFIESSPNYSESYSESLKRVLVVSSD
ncbi:MAG: hypothetical protein JHC93_08065 [Parachlamydiales bacterium]|nr:hypothetical protein [Parachlamydiales bacterium]